jgi:hypothetical protein
MHVFTILLFENTNLFQKSKIYRGKSFQKKDLDLLRIALRGEQTFSYFLFYLYLFTVFVVFGQSRISATNIDKWKVTMSRLPMFDLHVKKNYIQECSFGDIALIW